MSFTSGDGLVAHWDFGRDDWRRPSHGDPDLVLEDGAGSGAAPGEIGGRRLLVLNGTTDFLRIPAERVAGLDVGRRSGQVTVLAQIVRTGPGLGFVAGMWQEDDDDPGRQYGLFVDLALYGGAHRVAGHVSRHGGASDGLPYSRDACASARMVEFGRQHLVGFTFDGERAVAHLDGLVDQRPSWTEPAAPYGFAERYPKNPFAFPAGLNRDRACDFTIGAVRLTRGMGNFFSGGIASVTVLDRALSADEVFEIALEARDQDAPVASGGFWRPTDQLDRRPGALAPPVWPPGQYGWTELDLDDGSARPEVDVETVPTAWPVGVRRDGDGCWLGVADDRDHLVVRDVGAMVMMRFRLQRQQDRQRVVPVVLRYGRWWRPRCRWHGDGTAEIDLTGRVAGGLWEPLDLPVPADGDLTAAVGFHLLAGQGDDVPAGVGEIEFW